MRRCFIFLSMSHEVFFSIQAYQADMVSQCKTRLQFKVTAAMAKVQTLLVEFVNEAASTASEFSDVEFDNRILLVRNELPSSYLKAVFDDEMKPFRASNVAQAREDAKKAMELAAAAEEIKRAEEEAKKRKEEQEKLEAKRKLLEKELAESKSSGKGREYIQHALHVGAIAVETCVPPC